MGKSANKENEAEFSIGDVVRLKSGSPDLVICEKPPGSNDMPGDWAWTVMWVDEMPPHPSYFAIPAAALTKKSSRENP